MNDIAIYRNDYPLLSRSKPLTPKAATLEALIIAKIKPTRRDGICEVPLTSKDLLMYGICDGANRHYMRDLDLLAEELVTYRIALPEKEGYQARWIPLVSRFYVHDSNNVTIGVDEDLAPYLIELREKFTQLEVIEIATLSNQYAKKMYMLLKTIEYKGGDTLSLADLHSSLGTTEIKAYKNFKEFNRTVLKPSINDLNESSDIFVEWETIRHGRKVGAVNFKISKNPNHHPKLQIVEPITDEIPHEIRVFLDAYGFNDDSFIEALLIKYEATLFLEATQLFDRRMSNTSIKNKAGLYRLRIVRYVAEVITDRKRKKELELQLQNKEVAEAAFMAEKSIIDRDAIDYVKSHREEVYELLDEVQKEMYDLESCPDALLNAVALDIVMERRNGV